MKWKTHITKVEPNKLTVRGKSIDELIGKISFAEAIYLILKGKLPDKNAAKLLDAILVSSIDHGVTPPSCISARTSASCRVPISSAIASGILTIGPVHGGAIENCMITLKKGIKQQNEDGINSKTAALRIIEEVGKSGEKISGFGHRIHTDDPRTNKLISLAKELNLAGKGVEMAEAIADVFFSQGKKLPINVDGAIAALLFDLDFPIEIANAFFIMSRIPGLVAHIYEEIKYEKPMRTINPDEAEFSPE